jgi:HrpA-like RNA helicase
MGMNALSVFPCSQAAVNQRSGRAGRTAGTLRSSTFQLNLSRF